MTSTPLLRCRVELGMLFQLVQTSVLPSENTSVALEVFDARLHQEDRKPSLRFASHRSIIKRDQGRCISNGTGEQVGTHHGVQLQDRKGLKLGVVASSSEHTTGSW